ncbi:hypothetical protein MRX96_054024 [Rhipicephalus microplus]
MFALEAADSHTGHVGITQPIVRTLDCGGVPVNMQVDTGSPVSVITWPTYERNKTVWPKLRGSPLKLTCFLGRLPVRGQLQLKVSCGNKSMAGSLQVLGCSGPNLCGRDLIQAFHMLEAPVMNVNTSGEQLPLLGADDVNVDRYRRTPQAGGRTPAQLLMGYDLRSRLDNAVSIPPSPVDRPPPSMGGSPGASLGEELRARRAVDSSQHYIDRRSPPGECRWSGGGKPLGRHSDQVKPRELEHDQGEVGDSRCPRNCRRGPSRRNTEASANKERDRREPLNPVLRRSGRQRKPPDRYSP